MRETTRRTRFRRFTTRALAAAGVVTLLGSLVGCTLQAAVTFVAESTITCTEWTMTARDGEHAAAGEAGDGITYLPQVVDGSGNLLYLGEAVDLYEFARGDVEIASYATAPTTNPIIAGIYASDLATYFDNRAEFVGYCPGLPFAAEIALAPGQSSPTTALPSFDLRFSQAVTGFDVDDLVLGGTAAPSGATVALLSPNQVLQSYRVPTDPTGVAVFSHSTYYRVTITGVAHDGTVEVSLPAGAVAGVGEDTNIATGTATATIDTTGPVLDAPDDLTHQLLPGETSAQISWTDPAANDPSGVASGQCSPASGSAFISGDSTVSCTATDTLGNGSETSFVVRVLPAQTPIVHIAPQASGDPDQGGSARFTVTATDYAGVTSPLPANDYAVTSSVLSDVIETSDGSFSVTFPHASPHVLTVTQLSTGASAQFTVQVTPAATGDVGGLSGGGSDGLSATGADPVPAVIIGMLLLAGGAVAGIASRRRRQSA